MRAGEGAKIIHGTPVDDLAEPWEFRRIPNLFEIVSYDYWARNYGYRMPVAAEKRMERYLSDPAGRAHALAVIEQKARASHTNTEEWDRLPEWQKLELSQAVDMVAERFIEARRRKWQDQDDAGRRLHRTMGIASLGGATLDNEENYLIKKLFTAAGAIQIENQARI